MSLVMNSDDVGGGNDVGCTLLIKVMIVERVHLIIFDELFYYLITIGSSCSNLLIFSSLFKLHTNKKVYCVLNYKKN
jgi:hypothetical protein